jgi:FKBP-type peptidyl-prolyl cis-trans isomerase
MNPTLMQARMTRRTGTSETLALTWAWILMGLRVMLGARLILYLAMSPDSVHYSRFEEVSDGAPSGNKKRARESDAAGEEGAKSKAGKKAAKKMKAEDGSAKPVSEAKSEKKKEEKKPASEAKPKEFTTPGGVKVVDSTVGSGKLAKKGDKVEMRYIGRLEKGGKEFDRNTKGKPVCSTVTSIP